MPLLFTILKVTGIEYSTGRYKVRTDSPGISDLCQKNLTVLAEDKLLLIQMTIS